MLADHLTRPLLTAFGGVITEPAKSTVQVYCDGFRACPGAVVRADGYIVTKNSELKGKIECQLNNETQKREAKVVARDEMTDLAILKVDAKNMPVVPWSTEDPPAVGSWLATTGLSQLPISIGVVSVAARTALAESRAWESRSTSRKTWPALLRSRQAWLRKKPV